MDRLAAATDKKTYAGLQVGRGLAAVLVLLHHASLGSDFFYGGKAFYGFFEFGYIGVDFFFVLSGFVIYSAHCNDQSSFNAALIFCKKRIIRVYPPFIVISVSLLLIYNLYPSLSNGNREVSFTSSLFLLPDYPSRPALSVSWTLMHEMLFYTAFLLYFFSKKFFYVFFCAWILLILFMLGGSENTTIGFLLNVHNLQFFLGMLAAIAVKKEKEKYFYNFIGLLIVFTSLILKKELHASYMEDLHILLNGIGFMCLTIGLCSTKNRVAYPRILMFFGSASYSIYLIHDPGISILNRISRKIFTYGINLHPNYYFTAIALSSLLLGILYYLILEKPVTSFLKKKYLKYS
ncbi:acyltransferase family protein [Candidatus Electronema sp. PJ]|uniref:acyltransferase family protein n=1 Tax=Candidatus Electronema sp. PJ TaxID=3401572 RepID=UPI003AA9D51F